MAVDGMTISYYGREISCAHAEDGIERLKWKGKERCFVTRKKKAEKMMLNTRENT